LTLLALSPRSLSSAANFFLSLQRNPGFRVKGALLNHGKDWPLMKGILGIKRKEAMAIPSLNRPLASQLAPAK
jgi:hypothetical protein